MQNAYPNRRQGLYPAEVEQAKELIAIGWEVEKISYYFCVEDSVIEALIPEPPEPVGALFTATPQQGPIPLVVNFDGSGSTGPVATYSWAFGDGMTAEGPTVQHSFPVAGTFEVVLTVNGPDGQTDTEPLTITAEEAAPPA